MAGPRPTAIHFTLVFCVLLTLGLGSATWSLMVERKAMEAQIVQITEESGAAERDLGEAERWNTDMKGILGYTFDDVGLTTEGTPPPPNTVLAALEADLAANEGIVVAPNAIDALIAMRGEISRLELINTTYTDETGRLEDRTVSVETGINDREAQIQSSQQMSSARLQQLISQHDALVQTKQDTISRLTSETRSEQTEKEALRDELNRVRMDYESRITEREEYITKLNRDLDAANPVSYDRADGMIVDVDNTRQEVYINLGSADLLTEQVTFSVYVQNHNGIGKSVNDVKGAIEITRILGAHQALGRITYDDITRPIAPGDPIFSPIWQSGISEQFAFVGIVDLDGDKIGDWDILRDIIEHAGSRIQLYIDDEGYMQPAGAGLSVQTKYLVIGTILDQTDYPGVPEMQDVAGRIQQHHKDFTDIAVPKYGTREVTAEEFLIYIGYHPQEYHWVPGQQRRFDFQGGTPPPTAIDLFGQDATRNDLEGLTEQGGYYDSP